VGFALHSSRLSELKVQLDAYARRHLTLADFEPFMNYDSELSLDQITPELFQLVSRLEPFGVGNPEPVFVATETRLMAPPRVLKEKHIKLKLAPTENREQGTENWRRSLAFNAMGWRMAERMNQEQILQGDELDIAFTISHNDHPDFGGLELSLRDFKRRPTAAAVSETAVESATQS
jgi:single-stranded-DNA-specific exonuclease